MTRLRTFSAPSFIVSPTCCPRLCPPPIARMARLSRWDFRCEFCAMVVSRARYMAKLACKASGVAARVDVVFHRVLGQWLRGLADELKPEIHVFPPSHELIIQPIEPVEP